MAEGNLIPFIRQIHNKIEKKKRKRERGREEEGEKERVDRDQYHRYAREGETGEDNRR